MISENLCINPLSYHRCRLYWTVLLRNREKALSHVSAVEKVGENFLNTLYEFLDATEAIYLFQVVKKYNPSVLKQELGEKKAYVIDNGLLNAVTFKFSKDLGKLLENAVHLDLRMKGLQPFFHKDRRECDFIIQRLSGEQHAVQVATSIDDPDTSRREIRGLIDACKRLKTDRGTIITFAEEDLLYEDNVTIRVLPAYKFFLGDTQEVSAKASRRRLKGAPRRI